MEYKSWALKRYFMKCLMEEVGVQFDSITTEAF
jgi:hypothetical protein